MSGQQPAQVLQRFTLRHTEQADTKQVFLEIDGTQHTFAISATMLRDVIDQCVRMAGEWPDAGSPEDSLGVRINVGRVQNLPDPATGERMLALHVGGFRFEFLPKAV